jgi:hypothetical protein
MINKIENWFYHRLYILTFIVIVPIIFIFSKEFANSFPFLLGKSILEFIVGVVILLGLISIYLQYRIKDKIVGEINDLNRKDNFYRQSHIHFYFSHMAFFILTILGLLFTAYSETFWQQSESVNPIIRGLNNNETSFPLDSLNSITDTTKLVFVLDVSGSMNATINKININWIDESEIIITDYKFLISSNIQDTINVLKKRQHPSDLVKLKMCELLIRLRDSLIKDKRNYNVSLFSFGKNADVQQKGFNFNNDSEFEKLISTILGLKCSPDQASKTDNEKVIKKINYFINPPGSKDAFNRPKTVISIFSDFINDSKFQDTSRLSKIISEISNKSTFFNLFYLESKHSVNFINKIKVLPFFNKSLYPGQINLQAISDKIDLRCANFRSPYYLEFIINKPFYINSCKICLKTQKGSPINIKLIRQNKDDWQQFRVNSIPVNFEASYPIKNDDYLIFSGHAPDRFSQTIAEFEFPNNKEKILCEIIFEKGLSNFISKLFFSCAVIILFISLLYFFYLIISAKLFNNFKMLFKGKINPESV